MLCKKPYERWDKKRRQFLVFGCGQCLACRINKRRVWTTRLLLESYCHEKISFVTLTYDDDHLPLSDGVPVLQKPDLQSWFKRLRFKFRNRQIRYYAAGEYGSKSRRPHYHVILFGVSPDELDPDWWLYVQHNKDHPSVLRSLWGKGLVHVGEFSKKSAQYVAGYVTKKYVKQSDGIQREFTLMSLKPGIGASALHALAETIQSNGVVFNGTAPVVRIENQKWPLGRYLAEKIGEVCADFRGDRDSYFQLCKDLYFESTGKGLALPEFLAQRYGPQIERLEARDRIFNQRDKI